MGGCREIQTADSGEAGEAGGNIILMGRHCKRAATMLVTATPVMFKYNSYTNAWEGGSGDPLDFKDYQMDTSPMDPIITAVH